MARLQNKVRIIIEIARKEEGEAGFTVDEQWDIITAAAVTTRAAIERYIHPDQRLNALKAAAKVIRDKQQAKMSVIEQIIEYVDQDIGDTANGAAKTASPKC